MGVFLWIGTSETVAIADEPHVLLPRPCRAGLRPPKTPRRDVLLIDPAAVAAGDPTLTLSSPDQSQSILYDLVALLDQNLAWKDQDPEGREPQYEWVR